MISVASVCLGGYDRGTGRAIVARRAKGPLEAELVYRPMVGVAPKIGGGPFE